jgi:hypothetical protein
MMDCSTRGPSSAVIPAQVVALFESHIRPAYRWSGTAFYAGKKSKTPLTVITVITDIERKDPTIKPVLDVFRADLPVFILQLAKKWLDEHVLVATPMPEFARKIFSAKFRWYSQASGDRLIYYRTDLPNTWEFIGCNPPSEKLIQVLVCSPMYRVLEAYYYANYLEIIGPDTAMADVPPFSDFVTQQYKKFILETSFRFMSQPATLSSEPSEPCFYFFDRAKLVAGPHPGWDSFCGQMEADARPIFRAWLYSVFEAQNTSRQVLWITDNGYTGKSTAARAIASMFLRAVAALSHGAVERDWFFSTVYGKRLIIYPDNKNANLLMTEKIHAVCGGDLVQVERKHEAAFSAQIYAKLLVFSNTYPEVNPNRRHETTRILFIPMIANQTGPHWTMDGRPCGYPEYQAQLESEMYCFLHDCRKDYNNLCPTHEDIVLPISLYEAMISAATSQEYILFEELFDRYFVLDKESSIGCAEIYRFIMDKMPRWNDFTYAHFKNFLIDVHGVRQIRPSSNRIRFFGGIKYKSQQSAPLTQSSTLL